MACGTSHNSVIIIAIITFDHTDLSRAALNLTPTFLNDFRLWILNPSEPRKNSTNWLIVSRNLKTVVLISIPITNTRNFNPDVGFANYCRNFSQWMHLVVTGFFRAHSRVVNYSSVARPLAGWLSHRHDRECDVILETTRTMTWREPQTIGRNDENKSWVWTDFIDSFSH